MIKYACWFRRRNSPNLIYSDPNRSEWGNCLWKKLRNNNLCVKRFGTWKVQRLNQNRSKAGIPGWVMREEWSSRFKFKQPFLNEVHEKFGIWTGPTSLYALSDFLFGKDRRDTGFMNSIKKNTFYVIIQNAIQVFASKGSVNFLTQTCRKPFVWKT